MPSGSCAGPWAGLFLCRWVSVFFPAAFPHQQEPRRQGGVPPNPSGGKIPRPVAPIRSPTPGRSLADSSSIKVQRARTRQIPSHPELQQFVSNLSGRWKNMICWRRGTVFLSFAKAAPQQECLNS